MRGSFIVLEGPDGSGTTYHSRILAERLKVEGRDVLLTAEPTDGPIGSWIRKLLQGGSGVTAAALQMIFCADRAQHVEEVIEPALRAGKTVICDRYTLSTIMYGHVSGVDAGWLTKLNEDFPKPDRLILALPPFDVCLQRVSKRDDQEIFEKPEFLKRIHRAYANYAAAHTGIHVIDTSGDKEKVGQDIYRLL